MGVSLSSNRRRHHHNNNYYPHPHPPSQLISSSPYDFHHRPAAAPQPPPPPPPPPGYYYSTGGYPPNNYANPLMGRPNFGPYYDYQYNNHGWIPIRPMAALPPPPPPPTYVEHQQAKKVRNDVNVHKDTLKLVPDENNPDHHLVSFVFDALFDGSITIFYFAKEEMDCKFVPVYPESYVPVRVPFRKGPGQNFRQPSGTGIDLGFFALDDLSKPSSGEDVFPLVISAETCSPSPSTTSGSVDDLPPNPSPHMQITQAILEKNNEGYFKVRVIKQILWIDGVRYELREIYGIGNSSESVDDSDSGRECIICLTEPKNTAALPCRHMCMCSECAKALRLQSNKCPICRQHIEELMEIKINSNVDQ